MISSERFPHVEVTSASELRAWLLDNHERDEAVWLVTDKKAVPERYVSTQQVLDELVAFGWIDGIRRAVDDERTMQLISPRRTQPWAKSYRDRAERLIAEGFPPSVRRNILRWIATAKTEPTRTKRIGLTVAEAQAGRRVKSNG